MLRVSFEEDLNKLHDKIIEMLSLTEIAIDNSIEALKKQDVDLAKKVIKGDDEVDKLENKIEKMCLEILVRQAPVASDLRRIASTYKLITDLERIADHAEDISEIVVRIYNQRLIKPLVDIPNMANLSRSMVSRVISAYVQNDIDLAMQVCKNDSEVDELYHKIYNEIIEMMKANPMTVEQGVALISVAKYFERIADHATNIGEWIVFNETGKHKHLGN